MQNEWRTAVFVINGFLESGKTTFIKNAILMDPNLKEERILVICCEEGEEEYEGLPDNVLVHYVEDKDDLTPELLKKLDDSFSPTYVVAEYNGIWGMQSLYRTKIPMGWRVAGQFSVVDAATFENYYNNMKGIFADMLRLSARVYVNRCEKDSHFKFMKDSIKACSPRTDIIYMSDEEGIMNVTLEEDLPYDINDPVIMIQSDDYMTWYIDMTENIERYLGKTVMFTAQIGKPERFRDKYFLAGNMVITCCEDDKQFFGFVCRYERVSSLKMGTRMKLRCEVHFEEAPEYGGNPGPVLYVKKAVSA